MLRRVLNIALISILLALVSCGPEVISMPEPAATTESPIAGTLVLGKVSDDPAEKIEEYQPIANHLASNLTDLDINVGTVLVAPDLETMANWLAISKVDLYFDNPYAALFVSDHSGGQPILVRVKEGEAQKHAVFFALDDGRTTSFDDLAGQVIAIEEPDSASGYMLPVAHLLEMKMIPVEVTETDASVAPNEIGYIFSLDDDNTLQWVFNNRVIAGAVDNEAFEEYSEANPGKLRVLAETEPVLRHQLTIVRPNMDPVLLEAIKALLLDLDQIEVAQAILTPSETVRFDVLDGDWNAGVTRSQEMYARLKEN